MNNKEHWENIYLKKEIDGVSWYQKIPSESIQLIEKYSVSNSDKIIDIGCGKSFFADNLLELNYNNITLVDISSNALKEVKLRLKNKSINFIESDILNFNSNDKYDIWHDRAVFHFVTDNEGIEKYISLCNKYINDEGILIIGTFAEDGPLKCSGLEIKRYSVDQISSLFKGTFELVESFKMLHKTPFDTEQSFSFCILRKFTDS
tara:strand:+ start:369 stop:983 length:615 start_codon:yes stop_codon:yes gene_type:complete